MTAGQSGRADAVLTTLQCFDFRVEAATTRQNSIVKNAPVYQGIPRPAPYSAKLSMSNLEINNAQQLARDSTAANNTQSAKDAPALNLVTLSQAARTDKDNPAKPTADRESRTYRQWFDGYKKGTLSYDDSLKLVREYVRDFSDEKQFHNVERLRYLRYWLNEQEKQPLVRIDLRDCLRSGNVPSNNEIGLRIARSVGFTEGEIQAYAAGKVRDPAHYGEAFYNGSTLPGANKYWVDQAKRDPSGGYVSIPEFRPGAIQQLRSWRDHYRLEHTPPVDWDQVKLTAAQNVLKHVINPAANFADTGLSTVGDIIQGAGLPAHLFTDKTFMDDFARYLRKKGDSLPMMGLYTDKEMHDAMVCLVNIYAMAGGSGAIYMTPGAAAGILKLTPGAAMIVADVMGAAGNAGQVYESSMTRQAAHIAAAEVSSGKIKESELARRVEEIKEGKVDPADKELMERRALISAALAAPAGAVQGKLLSELGGELASGVPVERLPEEVIRDLSASLTRGGALGMTQLLSNEEAMVLGGAQRQDEAAKNIDDNLVQSVVGTSLLFGTREANPNIIINPEKDAMAGKELQAGLGITPEPGSAEILARHKPAYEWSGNELMDFMDKWKDLSVQDREKFLAEFKGFNTGDQYVLLRRMIAAGVETMPESWRSNFERETQMRGMRRDQSLPDSEMLKRSADFTRDAKAMLESVKTSPELSGTERTRRVQQALQSLSDAYADKLGIPRPKIEMVDRMIINPRADGDYSFATNTIRIKSSLGDQVMANSLAHELTHAEQRALIVRYLADKIGISNNPSEAELRKLRQECSNSVHNLLGKDDSVAKTVTNREPLDTAQTERAQRLIESMRLEAESKIGTMFGADQSPGSYKAELGKLKSQLETDTPFVLVDRNLKNLDKLFGSTQVPDYVTELRKSAARGDESSRRALYEILLRFVNAEIASADVTRWENYRMQPHEMEAHDVSNRVTANWQR